MRHHTLLAIGHERIHDGSMENHEYATLARVEETHPWFVNRRRMVLGLVRRFASHLAQPRILDAGSGTGVNLADYAALGAAVGIELDFAAASLSHQRGNRHVAVGDLCRLPFETGRFDLVISTDVIEHIADDVQALSEMHRVLVPQGRILLTTPAYSWAYSSHDRFLHHVRRYDEVKLLGAIGRASLRVVHSSRYNVLLGGPLFLARWLNDRIARTPPTASDVGRPVPGFAARALDWIWRLEATLAPRVDWRFGLTHVVVLADRDAIESS